MHMAAGTAAAVSTRAHAARPAAAPGVASALGCPLSRYIAALNQGEDYRHTPAQFVMSAADP
jgi:hypothetical protein